MLTKHQVLDADWGGGLKGAVTAAAHEWYDIVHPDHDEQICDEFNDCTIYAEAHGYCVAAVMDLDGRVWVFLTERLDSADFPLDPDAV